MSRGGAAATSRRIASRWPVAMLLLLHLALLLDGARRDSVTFDEVAFVTGGLSHWRTGDYRLSPDGGALPQRLHALPLVLAGVELPENPAAWDRSDAWSLGHELFYGSGEDPARLIFLARVPVSLLSMALALLVHAAAARLFGRGGGLLALVLYALSPAFLAHGRLATADLVFSFALLAALLACERTLRSATPGRVLLSCAAVGACFVAKMSAVLLIPMVGLVVLVRLAAGAPMTWGARTPRPVRSGTGRIALLAALTALHAAAALLAAWTASSFRYEALRDPRPGASLKEGGWEAITGDGDGDRAADAVVAFAREARILPEAWLFGFQYSLEHSRERRAYALQRWSMTGWRWFFPFVVALKTPLAALALVALGLAALPIAWRSGRRATLTQAPRDGLPAWACDVTALAPMLALLAVYWPIALMTPLNIGLRHVLPTLPALFILAGAAWPAAPAAGTAAGRRARTLVLVLGILAAAEGLLAHPLHVAYMNPLGGSPGRRWTKLVDSSLDWGQDARRVAEWVSRETAVPDPPRVHVAWFGSSDPSGEGVRADAFLPGFLDQRASRPAELLQPGIYLVSATVLVQVFSNFPGPWAQPYEDAWRRADALADPYLRADAGDRAALSAERGGAYWDALLTSHEQLRMARLCSWLRHAPADEAIGGGAVLAYRLSEGELEEALHGPPRELVAEPSLPWAGSR